MHPMTRLSAYAAIFALTFFVGKSEVGAIMRRHDLLDADYLVSADAYPAIVDLLEPGDCLATLVEPRWLLTAAHCAADIPELHSVRVGGAQVDVEGVVCHPDYEGFTNDVALVRLAAEVSNVSPIALYRERDEADQAVLFVGRGDHGTGREGQREASNDGQTRQATNTVHDASTHWLEFVFNQPSDGEVTPLEGLSGDGDSGGPALIDTPSGPQVAGISSWQDARRRKIGTYGVHDYYTRVSGQLAFIEETKGPNWDGEYRDCPPECGCRTVGAPSSRGPLAPLSLSLACALLAWRRRAASRLR